MADVTSYNYGMIGEGVARLNSLNAQFQETAERITQHYMRVSDSSMGQAVDAGVQFNQQMSQARASVNDLTQRVSQGIVTAQGENQMRDITNAGHMG
jgi:hypothetical protein